MGLVCVVKYPNFGQGKHVKLDALGSMSMYRAKIEQKSSKNSGEICVDILTFCKGLGEVPARLKCITHGKKFGAF